MGQQCFVDALNFEAKDRKLLDDIGRNLQRFKARHNSEWSPAKAATPLEMGATKAVQAFLEQMKAGVLLHGVLVSWAGI